MGVLGGLILKPTTSPLSRWYNFTGAEQVSPDLGFNSLSVGAATGSTELLSFKAIMKLDSAFAPAFGRSFFIDSLFSFRKQGSDIKFFNFNDTGSTNQLLVPQSEVFDKVNTVEFIYTSDTSTFSKWQCIVVTEDNTYDSGEVDYVATGTININQMRIIGTGNFAAPLFMYEAEYNADSNTDPLFTAIWEMDEFSGTVAEDSSGNNNDGTIDLGGSSEASFFSGGL